MKLSAIILPVIMKISECDPFDCWNHILEHDCLLVVHIQLILAGYQAVEMSNHQREIFHLANFSVLYLLQHYSPFFQYLLKWTTCNHTQTFFSFQGYLRIQGKFPISHFQKAVIYFTCWMPKPVDFNDFWLFGPNFWCFGPGNIQFWNIFKRWPIPFFLHIN